MLQSSVCGNLFVVGNNQSALAGIALRTLRKHVEEAGTLKLLVERVPQDCQAILLPHAACGPNVRVPIFQNRSRNDEISFLN